MRPSVFGALARGGPEHTAGGDGGGGDRPTRSWSLRGTFQKMSDWGDDFERRHFNGDFLGAVASAPQKAGNAVGNTFTRMSDWGDEIERQHFDGDFAGAIAALPLKLVDTLDQYDESVARLIDADLMGCEPMSLGCGALGYDPMHVTPSSSSTSGSGAAGSRAGGDAAADAVASSVARSFADVARPSSASPPLCGGAHATISPTRGSASAVVLTAGQEGMWEESQRLQAELASEREKRRGRSAALDALDSAARSLRLEIAEERQQCAAAEAEKVRAAETLVRNEHALRQVQETHDALHGLHLHQEAEIRKLVARAAAEAAATARAHRECEEEGPRAWARPGCETDALKEAKLELAQVLTLLDEARLERRRELKALQSDLEVLEVENLSLRRGPDYYEAPNNSFRSSLSRLFAVAVGRGDPFAFLERGSASGRNGAI
mmetsp:Transcript_74590/g.207300  ORF Transcript_74590/g.207300 Transcript_74590/m.207300 type:complete len:436 (+) Transcript_74590:71-1378(+)